ncbi:AAA family ATPase [Lysinibacillus sp. JNUCC-52]|uniref:AAA family ATPase n=1 Tax=Lysinibacillus sp. JNUCC-52 TaxID=2792480 RepID=UPI0019354BEA|nr:hypothetical protein JNUCC52_17795 [Lysinibacillus sp. JNUCC-52]
MQLVINEFSILSPSIEKAFNEKFRSGVNLIVGEKDTGKSTLARSILYTFGCDVKGLDLITSSPNNIYILDFNIDNDRYLLVRQKLKQGRGKNCFKLLQYKNKELLTYYDTTSFKEKLNELLNIKLSTLDKNGIETKLFPNHIFLPFYTDQDNSWQSYLKDTFSNINFISDYKKLILEYFTGARSNNYYDLILRKNKLKRELQNLEAIIKSKELIIEENLRNIKILEDIDINNFKKNYEIVLKLFNSVIETEHQLKDQLNQNIFEKNSLKEMEDSINSSIEVMIEENMKKECPTCNQSIFNTIEDNYSLQIAKQNLIQEREKIKMQLHDVQKNIDNLLEELNQTVMTNKEYEEKLNANANVVSMAERADSYALSRINIRLEEELEGLLGDKVGVESKLDVIETSLKELNSIDVASKYKKLMIKAFEELNIKFSFNNYYNSNLESVNINLSGASKVQAFIAQYVSIYQMSQDNKEVIDIPMFIDTFLKDDFNNIEIEKTVSFIFSKLEDQHQSFVFISNNEQTLKSVEGYNFARIDLEEPFNIFNKGYKEIFERFESILK